MAGCDLIKTSIIRSLTILSFLFLGGSAAATPVQDTARSIYTAALTELEVFLQSNGSFKDGVFVVENAFMGNQLDRAKFYTPIESIVNLCSEWFRQNNIPDYRYGDSLNFKKNAAIFAVLKDTIRIHDYDSQLYIIPPFEYDFEDFAGAHNWSNMFVTKLLITRKGNCHSLPYLYKILADELGAICWLGLAPNHMYVKNRCKKSGWYNTELTSGTFPIDAWISGSGYIPLQAIQNGIYMDTLSNQQAIALCVLDLAKGYEFQTKNYSDGFILKCCNLVLQYHPLNVQAMLLKAETLKRMYELQPKNNNAITNTTYKEMEGVYVKLFELGYREMPESMYVEWLKSVTAEGSKYTTNQLKETVPAKMKAF